jgi:hypothetical protein
MSAENTANAQEEQVQQEEKVATAEKLTQRQYISAGVALWGDRGPQPLFDAISTLITIDKTAQECCGFHTEATVTFGPNRKVVRALRPDCSEELTTEVLPSGKTSVTPRVPINPGALKERLQSYITGEVKPTDDNVINAIHILDMDFTDVDNSTAMLTLQKALTNAKNEHPLFVFVSVRKMGAKLAPLQVHMGENGPIKTEEGKIQFCVCTGNPTEYVLTDNLGPHIQEQEYETTFHSEKDMKALHSFAASVLVRQLRLQNPMNNNTATQTKVGMLGTFEIAGLSHNVHKLEWYMYNKDGTYRSGKDYKADAKKYFEIGLNDDTNEKRENEFHKVMNEYGTEDTTSVDDMLQYLRKDENAKTPIIVHCAGPMFMLSELAKHEDIKQRVSCIGAMFLAHDGEANLLGRNFNEGVCPLMTETLWGEDGQNIHRTFPNAEIICVTTETCKSDGLSFVP